MPVWTSLVCQPAHDTHSSKKCANPFQPAESNPPFYQPAEQSTRYIPETNSTALARIPITAWPVTGGPPSDSTVRGYGVATTALRLYTQPCFGELLWTHHAIPATRGPYRRIALSAPREFLTRTRTKARAMTNDSGDTNGTPDVPRIGEINPTYNYIRAHQLEGTCDGGKTLGVWPISGCRISRGWGNVAKSDWPDRPKGATWLIAEPPGLDATAKRLRIHHYQRVRSLSQCLIMLGHVCPVTIALGITEQWFDAKAGCITLPEGKDEIIAAHTVGVLGFDLRCSGLIFQNFMGEGLGTLWVRLSAF